MNYVCIITGFAAFATGRTQKPRHAGPLAGPWNRSCSPFRQNAEKFLLDLCNFERIQSFRRLSLYYFNVIKSSGQFLCPDFCPKSQFRFSHTHLTSTAASGMLCVSQGRRAAKTRLFLLKVHLREEQFMATMKDIIQSPLLLALSSAAFCTLPPFRWCT